MIDTQAKPKPYFRLMALVALMGIVSALVTFVFMAFVNGSIAWIWEEAAAGFGHGPAPVHPAGVYARWPAGRSAGELLWGSQCDLLRADAGIRQDRALRLSPRPRDPGDFLRLPDRRRGPGTRSSPGGYLRWDRDLDRRQAQARRKGDPHDGFRRPERHVGRLCHQSLRRGAAQFGVCPGRHDRHDDLFLGPLPQPACRSRRHDGLCRIDRLLLRHAVCISRLYPQPD